VATCRAVPLVPPCAVTTAFKGPAPVGRAVRETSSFVAVASTTVPSAPLLKETVLLAAIRSNPQPLIFSVVAASGRIVDLAVMTGRATTFATMIGGPLLPPKDRTTAFSGPRPLESFVRATVSSEGDAFTIVPMAEPESLTEFVRLVGSKPVPRITSVCALSARRALLLVTRGRSTTVATGTVLPLLRPLVVITAESTPRFFGRRVSLTTSEVDVASTTLPRAPPVNTTELPRNESMNDCPASYHNGSGALSFADGHSEIHKWRDEATLRRTSQPTAPAGRSPTDYLWMAERTTGPR